MIFYPPNKFYISGWRRFTRHFVRWLRGRHQVHGGTDQPVDREEKARKAEEVQTPSDDELEVEEDEDDWQEVDNENITVTVAGDGRQFTADDQVRQTLLLHFLNFPTAVALIILYTGDVHAHP